MSARRLLAALGALAACGGPGRLPADPPPRQPATAVPAAEASPPASEEPAKVECELRMSTPRPVELENRWFIFDGARWDIETPGLPAISKDGKRVLVEGWEELTRDSPHLTLQMVRASDGAVLETRKLLPYAEKEATDDSDKLCETWTERLRAFAAKLDAEGWEPLEKCWLGHHDPYTECRATQEVRCGPAVAITYTEPRLTVAARGAGAITKSSAAWRAAYQCSWLREVAFDSARRLVVARVDRVAPMCHYCYVPSVLTVVHLPASPPRIPSPIVVQCPAGMSNVPAGHVHGAANEPGCAALAPHDPAIGAFCVDDAPVTVDAYGRCVADKGCFTPVGACSLKPHVRGSGAHGDSPPFIADPPLRGTDPVSCDRAEERAAYCAWAGKRSLTSDEMEYLARLGRPGGADGDGFRCALGLGAARPP